MAEMKLLAVYDDRNYQPHWHRHERHAVRAVIVRNGCAALVKSRKKGFYQFPGGGIAPGETHLQSLVRETREEVGLTILPHTVQPLGMVREIRASQFAPETIFDQTSYYYFAHVTDEVAPQALEEYEKDLGYTLEWADMDKARKINLHLCHTHTYKSKFVLREAEILSLLLSEPQQIP